MTTSEASSPQDALLRSVLRAGRQALLAGLAGYVLAATLRYGLVERDGLGVACESGARDWRCDLRLLVIQAFLHHAFAGLSIAAAALGAWRRSVTLAGLAVGAGVVGMTLYGFEWSAPGVLAGAWVIARLERDRGQYGETQREH
jgi:hypothetical protein